MTQQYDAKFFESIRDSSAKTARKVVPFLIDLVKPTSVVDVGCGDGTWLAAFANSGVADIHGIDGDYVQRSSLLIPQSCFEPYDLSRGVPNGRRYDLAMSLEVAEHLPDSIATEFVKSLTAMAPIVLFSAAVPGQGGTGHLNEQWPAYWIDLFSRCSYRVVDAIRWRYWDDRDVAWWYAQNLLLFCDVNHPAAEALIALEEKCLRARPASVVHPELLRVKANEIAALQNLSLRQALGQIPRALASSLRRRARALGGRAR